MKGVQGHFPPANQSTPVGNGMTGRDVDRALRRRELGLEGRVRDEAAHLLVLLAIDPGSRSVPSILGEKHAGMFCMMYIPKS